MNISSEVKTDRKTVFEMDPIFIYKVSNQLGRRHKASDWNVLSPDWYGKLRIFEAGSYCCEAQFENNNGIFGVANIKDSDFLSSRALQKVLDSSRYFTLKIKATSATEDELFGIGFLSRSDATSLRGALHDYFLSQNQTSGVGIKDKVIEPLVKVSPPGLLPTPKDSELLVNTTGFNHYCSLCPNNFVSSYLLNQHISLCHADDTSKSKQPLFDGDNRNVRKRCLTELPRESSAVQNNNDINGSTQPKFGKIQLIQQEPSGQQQHHNLLQNPLFAAQDGGQSSHLSVPVSGNDNSGTSYQDAATKLLFCHLCVPPSPDFPPTNRISVLLPHWEEVHGLSKPPICRLCFLFFPTPEKLSQHKIDARHYQCPHPQCHCEFTIEQEKNFIKHLYKVHKQIHA